MILYGVPSWRCLRADACCRDTVKGAVCVLNSSMAQSCLGPFLGNCLGTVKCGHCLHRQRLYNIQTLPRQCHRNFPRQPNTNTTHKQHHRQHPANKHRHAGSTQTSPHTASMQHADRSTASRRRGPRQHNTQTAFQNHPRQHCDNVSDRAEAAYRQPLELQRAGGAIDSTETAHSRAVHRQCSRQHHKKKQT